MMKKIVKNYNYDKYILFAHDCRKFDYVFIKQIEKVKILKQIKIGGRIIKLVVEYNSNKIVFLDSFSFLQAPLDKCSELFHTQERKTEFDVGNETPEYIIQDVKVLADILCRAEKYFNKMGESMTTKLDVASIALRIMLKMCFDIKNIKVTKSPVMSKFFKEACYGERVLNWKKIFVANKKPKFIKDEGNKKENEFETGDIVTSSEGLIAIRVNSLYPSAMFIGGCPVGSEEKIIPEEELYDESQSDEENARRFKLLYNRYSNKSRLGIYEVEIDLGNNRFPLLPYRTNKEDCNDEKYPDIKPNTLIYRSGKIKGVYTSIDLQEAENDGAKILKIYRGVYWIRSQCIFEGYIKSFYDERNRLKSENNGIFVKDNFG